MHLDTVKMLMSDRGMTRAPQTSPLRETLIESGLALLDEAGLNGLTLRRVAARAGVSHAAPAHHFTGLPDLLAAIATRAFAEFTAMMEAEARAAPETPFARLSAICRGYLRFADGHGARFRLMFTAPGVNREDPEFQAAARRAYDVLRQGCAPFGDAAWIELGVWSLVHGYALLDLGAPQPEASPVATAPFDDLLFAFLRAAPPPAAGADSESG